MCNAHGDILDLNIRGKTALVTGASRGLGFACAKALVSEGANIAICSHNSDRIQAAARALSETADDARTAGFVADVTQSESLERFVQEARRELGPIDIAVISTGLPPSRRIAEATPEEWHQALSLVLQPASHVSKLVLGEMKSRGFGRLVFIGSIWGLEPNPASVLQSTFKTALNALTKCIAEEYAAFGITANIICPGFIDTELVQELATELSDKEARKRESILDEWRAIAPAKTLGEPDDIGSLAAYLCSPQAQFINGTRLVIDGGTLRQY